MNNWASVPWVIYNHNIITVFVSLPWNAWLNGLCPPFKMNEYIFTTRVIYFQASKLSRFRKNWQHLNLGTWNYHQWPATSAFQDKQNDGHFMGFHQPFKNRSLFASGPRYLKHQRIQLTYAISRQNRMSKVKTNLKFVENLILTLSVALRRVSALNVTYKLYIIRSDIHLAVLIYSSSFWRDGGTTNTHTHAHTHTLTHAHTIQAD